MGLIAAIELVADKATKRSFDPLGRVGARAAAFAAEEGLICRALGDTLALCPPLIVTDADIARIIARMGRAITRTGDWAKAEGLV